MVDTNSTIKSLLGSKFSQEQAVALCKIFSDTFGASYDEPQALTTTAFKKALHKESFILGKHKNDLQVKQSADLIQAKSALSQLQRELRTGRQRARESLGLLRSELRLELAMEKGRQRDGSIGLLLKCEDLRAKADSQVADGRVGLGKLRHDLFYSMTGFFFTSVAALFGYLRYIA